MPNTCCMPGCKSNYEAKGNNVSVFRFPKDEIRRRKWVKSIHRYDFAVSDYSRVCIKHFADHFVLREDKILRPDGSVLITPRKQIKLTEDAYPTIIEMQPSYMTTSLPPKRKSPTFRHLQQEKRMKFEEERKTEADSISGFEDLKNKIIEKIKSFADDFILKFFENKIWIINITEDEFNTNLTCIRKCLTIHNDLHVTFYYKNMEINNKEFREILGRIKVCNTWSVLIKLLEYIKDYKKLLKILQ